jgi:hypothetical protein
MDTVGLRELRQDASAAPKTWRRCEDVVDAFAGPGDAAWQQDRDLVDQSLANPWGLGA